MASSAPDNTLTCLPKELQEGSSCHSSPSQELSQAEPLTGASSASGHTQEHNPGLCNMGAKKAGRPVSYQGDPDSASLSASEKLQIKRRIVNRESARRLRDRRQETLDVHHSQVAKLKAETEALRVSLEEKRGQQGKWIGQLARAQAQWGEATADALQLTARVQNLRRSLQRSVSTMARCKLAQPPAQQALETPPGYPWSLTPPSRGSEVSQWAEALAITEGRSHSCPSTSRPFKRPCLADSSLADSVLAGSRHTELGVPDSTLSPSALTGPSFADSRLTRSELINSRLSLEPGARTTGPVPVPSCFTGSELNSSRFPGSALAGSDQTSSRFRDSAASGCGVTDQGQLSNFGVADQMLSSASMAGPYGSNTGMREILMQDMQHSSKAFPGSNAEHHEHTYHQGPLNNAPSFPFSVTQPAYPAAEGLAWQGN